MFNLDRIDTKTILTYTEFVRDVLFKSGGYVGLEADDGFLVDLLEGGLDFPNTVPQKSLYTVYVLFSNFHFPFLLNDSSLFIKVRATPTQLVLRVAKYFKDAASAFTYAKHEDIYTILSLAERLELGLTDFKDYFLTPTGAVSLITPAGSAGRNYS